nr:hypothetical protein [Pseudoroseomonas oryzae]
MATSRAMAAKKNGHKARTVSAMELAAMEEEMNSAVPTGGV